MSANAHFYYLIHIVKELAEFVPSVRESALYRSSAPLQVLFFKTFWKIPVGVPSLAHPVRGRPLYRAFEKREVFISPFFISPADRCKACRVLRRHPSKRAPTSPLWPGREL